MLTPASVINRLLKKYLGRIFRRDPALEGTREERRRGRPCISGLALMAAKATPPVLCLPELTMTPTAHTRFPIDRSPGFGLRPVSYMDRLTLQSWDTLDKLTVVSSSRADGN